MNKNQINKEPAILDRPYPLRLSVTAHKPKNGKSATYFFKTLEIKNADLLIHAANHFTLSPSFYRDGADTPDQAKGTGHRRNEHIIEGGNILLIDCDDFMEDGTPQYKVIENKLEKYHYVKVPSASGKNHKWHYIIPVLRKRSIHPQRFKWETETFFKEIGIAVNDTVRAGGSSMCDLPISLQPSRALAPATAKGILTEEEAYSMSVVHEGEILDLRDAPEDISIEVGSTKKAKVKRTKRYEQTEELPLGSVWFEGQPISYQDAYTMIKEQAGTGTLSGFGCPHDNHSHTGDRTKGYGVAYLYNGDTPTIKCSGNSCIHQPYFVIPFVPKALEIKIQEIPIIEKPIYPVDFADSMVRRMRELQPKYYTDGKVYHGYQEFGALYNQCITYNNEGHNKIIVCPSSTGSGKTVSAHLYSAEISKLGYSTLLVVSEVTTAIESAEMINGLAGKEVAGTYYSISEKNPDHELRYEIDELPQITIITHALFIQRSDSNKEIDMLKMFNDKQRDLIIIDERIDLVKRISFATNEIPDAIAIMSRDDRLAAQTEELNAINEIIFNDGEHYNGSYTYDLNSVEMGSMEHILQDMSLRLPVYANEIENGKYNLKPKLRGTKRDKYDLYEEKKVANLLNRISFVISKRFTHTKEGKAIVCHREEDLSGAFGSVVVLDASASINPEYIMRLTNGHDIDFMKRVDSRTYGNATLNTCKIKKLNQSKSAFTGSGTPVEQIAKTLETIEVYLKIIDEIITNKDKLLVVTYKVFVPIFQEKCRHKNVHFIHWGGSDARGSNSFSDYNKLMTIGWYRRPQHVYVGSIVAINDFDDYQPLQESKMADTNYLKDRLIADDMVQFFNRGQTRISIDDEGNCSDTQLYMFTGRSEDVTGTIIDSIKSEMPGIKIDSWSPKVDMGKLKQKQSKVEERADRVIDWLRGNIEKCESIEQKTIIDTFGLSKNQMTALLNSPYFCERLEEEYISTSRLKKRGHPIRFHLPEIQQKL